MKKLFLGAAAALAVVAPGVAAADTSGNVAFSYNSLDDDSDGNKDDYLSLSGAVVTSLNDTWNLQFDAAVGDMSHGDHTDSFSSVTAHAFHRTDSHAFGGFAGYTSDEINGWFVGAEGAVYLDRFTLSGNALYGFNRERDDTTLASVGGAGTFFVTDNFSIGADANWFEWDFGGGFSQDGTVYGLNAEYQFAGSGFSVFGGYHQADYNDFFADNEVSSFSIGGRWHFGTASLIERDRSGASMPGGGETLLRNQVVTW